MNMNRVKSDWEEITGSSVDAQEVSGTIYGLCSEIAALRLFHKYNQVVRNEKTRMGYSENLKTWYFSLDMNSYAS